MDEVVPVIFAVFLGALIWRSTTGRTRWALSLLAVAVSGLTATVISGEWRDSWLYLLLDLGEAAGGLALGIALAHGWRRARRNAQARAGKG
ncbi:MAG TPA: hypothetical protein VKI44_28530 [Acetobacteraceae bacterium]|nr:hypothetical protein [Acetobacteraceae bacterium]